MEQRWLKLFSRPDLIIGVTATALVIFHLISTYLQLEFRFSHGFGYGVSIGMYLMTPLCYMTVRQNKQSLDKLKEAAEMHNEAVRVLGEAEKYLNELKEYE